MTSETAWWVAFALFLVGAGLTELRRINDPDEPLLPRGFPKWKHARHGAPWVAAAVVLFLAGWAVRLLDR